MCQQEVQYEHLKVANGAGQSEQKEMQLVFRTVRAISMTACFDCQKLPRVLARGSKAFALPQSRPKARTIAFERLVACVMDGKEAAGAGIAQGQDVKTKMRLQRGNQIASPRALSI